MATRAGRRVAVGRAVFCSGFWTRPGAWVAYPVGGPREAATGLAVSLCVRTGSVDVLAVLRVLESAAGVTDGANILVGLTVAPLSSPGLRPSPNDSPCPVPAGTA